MGDSIEDLLKKEEELEALLEKTRKEAALRVKMEGERWKRWLQEQKRAVESEIERRLERDRQEALKAAEDLIAQGKTMASYMREKLTSDLEEAVRIAVETVLER